MSSNFVELTNASFNCCGQWSDKIDTSGYFNSKPTYRSQMSFVDDEMKECTYINSYAQQCSQNLYWDDLHWLNDSCPGSGMEECYSVEELSLWERLLYEEKELDMMKQSFGLQNTDDEHTFMWQLIGKQQRLSQLLNEEESMWETPIMNQYHSEEEDFLAQQQDEDAEKESSGQRSSMEWYSELGSSSKCTTQSDSSKTDQQLEPQQKSRHCRHFLKGHCERGSSCGFRHDHSVFCTDMQKVFLGGLPGHLTASLLRQKLAEKGYTVLNHPKIRRWFSPQVCLGSVEEAQRLVLKGSIIIDGTVVRVRPFEAFTQDNKKKLPDEVERSVFLGGLAPGTTAKMIENELGRIGLVVVNIPLVKSGYCPQVALETVVQARTLLKLRRVQINKVVVNVRPFANIRRSSGKKKNRSSVSPAKSK